ncbi:MAG: glycosyltransferase family 4 protein [Planctomycetota bacterium]
MTDTIRVLTFNCGYRGTGVGDYGVALAAALTATGEVEHRQVTGQCTCEDRVGASWVDADAHCAYTALERLGRRVDRRRGQWAGRPHDNPERSVSGWLRGLRYRKQIAVHRPDVVHYHLDRNYYGLEPLSAIASGRRPPIVVTVHEIEDWGPLARDVLSRVEIVLVHSSVLADRLAAELSVSENVKVLLHGAPVPSTFPSADARTGIGCFGHLGPVKGTRYLIAALRRLASEGLHPLVRFFGNYSDDERLAVERMLSRHGLLEQARFEGFLEDGEDFHRAMESVAIVAAPYLESAGSGIVSYALAHGAAVVCSDVGALPETVGQAGRLVPPRRIGPLMQALRELVTDEPLRLRLGRQGWERARSSFDWPVIARRLVGLYREVISEPGKKSFSKVHLRTERSGPVSIGRSHR